MSLCPQCRAALAPHARFCSECGAWITVDAPSAAMPTDAVAFSGTMPASLDGPISPAIVSPPLPSSAIRISERPPPGTTLRSEPTEAEFEGARTIPQSSQPGTTTPSSPIVPTTSPLARSTMFRTAEPQTLAQAHKPLPTPLPPTPPPITDVPQIPGAPSLPDLSGSGHRARTIADAPAASLSSPPTSIARTSRPLAGFLVSYQYEPLGAFWPLGIGANVIGRAQGRPDIDVGIGDTTISSEHAIITIEGSRVEIEDRRSRNGTFVNGLALTAGLRAPLRHGDRLRIGSFETIVVLVPTPV